MTHPQVQTTAHGVEIADIEGDDFFESESDGSVSSKDDESEDDLSVASDVEDVPILTPQVSLGSRDSPRLSPVNSATAPTEIALGVSTDFPGPREHPPTEAPSLSDGTAFIKPLLDECFEAPLGKIYELLYGNDTTWLQDFLVANQKLLDVQVGQFADKAGKNTRSTSYVKPLSGPIGPKQTRCFLEDVVEMKDFEKCVQVVQSTTSPDVPSGDAFMIKTRFSLMWGPRDSTRLVSNCVIEWSKSSWIKGPIEKGATSGQMQYMADISEAIKSHLAAGTGGKKKRVKHKKPTTDNKDTEVDTKGPQPASAGSGSGSSGGWTGVYENINMNMLIFLLLFGLMVSMIRMQRSVRALSDLRQTGSSRSLADLRWQRQETDLWNWLAERNAVLGQTDSGPGASLDSDLSSLQIREALKQVKEQAVVLEKAQILAAKRD